MWLRLLVPMVEAEVYCDSLGFSFARPRRSADGQAGGAAPAIPLRREVLPYHEPQGPEDLAGILVPLPARHQSRYRASCRAKARRRYFLWVPSLGFPLSSCLSRSCCAVVCIHSMSLYCMSILQMLRLARSSLYLLLRTSSELRARARVT